MHEPLSEVSHEYTVGSTVYLHSVTSTTTDDKSTLVQFGAPGVGQPAGTYIKFYVRSAKNIQALSRYPGEQEHMLNFNSKFRVSSSKTARSIRSLPLYRSNLLKIIVRLNC
jgi:hypothetical protein